MALNMKNLTPAQEKKIFKLFDWMEDNAGESGADAKFVVKMKELAKDLGFSPKDMKDLEALAHQQFGESRIVKAVVRELSQQSVLTEERFWKIGGRCRTCGTEILLTVPEAQQSFNSVDQQNFDCPWCSSNTLKLKILSKG